MNQAIRIHGIPSESQSLFSSLCLLSPMTAQRIRSSVTGYITRLRIAKKDNPVLDLDTAELIASKLTNMVEHYGTFSDDNRIFFSAAVRYFIVDADADKDTESSHGFEDDAQVLQAVEQLILEGLS